MADIVTGTVSGQVDMTMIHKELADSRREQEVIGAQIRHETAIDNGRAIDAVKTSAWHNSDRTGTEADRVTSQNSAYFIAAQQYAFDNNRDLAALKAATDLAFSATLGEIKTASALGQAAAALESAKVAAAVALGQAQLAQTVMADGNSTRMLINDLNNQSLNRQLIERNADLVSTRDREGYWHGQYGNGQFAAVTSQLNAFQSQLQETRQGMVNFGTMAGVGQTSTSNNVR